MLANLSHKHGCVFAFVQKLGNCPVIVDCPAGWPFTQPPRAEAFSRPSARPVTTQWCVHDSWRTVTFINSNTADISIPTLSYSYSQLGRFPLLLHASGTVYHYTSLQHHLYRLSEEEAEAVFVQPQFSVLICCPYNRRDFILGLAAFGLNALFINYLTNLHLQLKPGWTLSGALISYSATLCRINRRVCYYYLLFCFIFPTSTKLQALNIVLIKLWLLRGLIGVKGVEEGDRTSSLQGYWLLLK